VDRLSKALIRLDADLRALGLRWALVGGMAVSFRAKPRTTQDLDVVIAVSGDREAERIALSLKMRGYRDYSRQPWVEREEDGRLMTVRLLAPGEEGEDGLLIDLLFASSGIEPEVVAAAELIEVIPGVSVPIAKSEHLLALKVLAGRPKDLEDIRVLFKTVAIADLHLTRVLLELIESRGFNRGRELLVELEKLQVSLPQ
jgi:predicted nucleotidyltransferase